MAVSLKKSIIGLLVIVVLIVAVIAAWAFLWPGRSSELQQVQIQRRDYAQSVAAIEQVIAADTADADVRSECRPILKTHNKKTAKAVVLVHGVSGCPQNMSGFGDWLHQAGYNVYIPRLPHHGARDNTQHSKVRAADLVQSMSQTAGLVSGLGDELGLVGHSGGGTMSTWLAQYGDGLFARVLLLAPFYEPDASKAPKWMLGPLRNLYGNHILPDQYSEALSYRALANFIIVKQNYRPDMKAPGLRHVAVIYSRDDGVIDQPLAESLPQQMAQVSGATYYHQLTPAAMGLKHSIVEPDIPEVQAHKQELYTMYQKAYEGAL